MLETIAHQGDGLRHAALQAVARLVPIASQGEEAAERALLWQLCLALQAYGYPPVVLDGTSLESAAQPGLADLLAHTPWLPGSAMDTDWTVMPAAGGLLRIARERAWQPPLARLGEVLRGGGVVLLVARSALLVPLLAGSQARPLLAITPGRRALVRSYGTFKQLHLQGGLTPTLVALATDAARQLDARGAGRTLQECAIAHLGCHADLCTVTSEPDPARPAEDMRRLALRLLESAVALGRPQEAHYLN